MIKGIGVDIIEIDRIARAIERHGEHFINRLFTRNEQLPVSAQTPTYFAGRFAAKEAVVKALGTGFRGITFLDIEVLNDSVGKPYINLSPSIAKKFDYPQLLLTISHSKGNAVACCIWQTDLSTN